MNFKKRAIVATCTVLALGAAAPAANAAARFTSASTAANQAFQGANIGSHQFKIGTNYVTTCTGVNFAGATPNGVGPWNSVSFTPTFSGCGMNISGVNYATTISCTGTWTLNAASATLNASTGAVTTSTITTNGPCTFDWSGTSCRYTLPPQTITTGINGQDRNIADTANAPVATAGASRLIINTGTNSIKRTISGTGCSSIGGPSAGTNVQDMSWIGTLTFKQASPKVALWFVP